MEIVYRNYQGGYENSLRVEKLLLNKSRVLENA